MAAAIDEKEGGRTLFGRGRSHSPSEKTVIVRYDPASGAVSALGDAYPYENVVDTNPVKALQGTYAVIVGGDGESFVMPAPAVNTPTGTLVIIPYSVEWDVQTVTVVNLPPRDQASRTFTIEGDILLSKADIVAATSRPSLNGHKLHPRAQWCFEPTASSDESFPTAGGGHVCVSCISCADGSWEICGPFYKC